MFSDDEIAEAFELDQLPARRVPHTPPRAALRARPQWGDGLAPATVRVPMAALCGRCGAAFEEHGAGFPHTSKGCEGFMAGGAVTLTARLIGVGNAKGNRRYLCNLQGALAPGSSLELVAPYDGRVELHGHGAGRVVVVQDGETLLDTAVSGAFEHEAKVFAGTVLVSVCC